MSKFLVTGGCGFIGSNFLNLMVRKYPEDSYLCLDALTYAGNLKNIEEIKDCPNFRFVKGDICDKKLTDDLFKTEGFDFVINFAAESHVDNSILNPEVFLRTNILGVQNLMDLSLKYNVKRFHQVSTDEVYGDLPLDGNEKFKETDKLNPSSPYSASKASADLLVLAYRRTYHLPCTISRSSNNYGPFQYPEKFIPVSIDCALKNEKIPVYGTGLNVRDWIYVNDNCNAIDMVVRNGLDGEIYNIGGNNEVKNIDIVKMILEILGKDETLISYVKDRPGHDLRYALDTTKMEEELGFKLGYSFIDAMKETIKWYLSNEEWLKEIKNKK